MNPSNDKSPNSLSSQQRAILLHSLSNFLQLNGFSKTLKSFRKEALIHEKGESCLIDIEEMCIEYLKSRNGTKEGSVQEQKSDASGKSSSKPKENGGKEGKKSEPTTEDGVVNGVSAKLKKSKKSKSAKDASEQVVEETQPEPAEKLEETHVTLPSEPAKKSKKNKKSKSSKDASEQVVEETQPKPTEKLEEALVTLPSEPAKKSKDKKKKHIDEPKHVGDDLQEKQSEISASNVEKKEKKVSNNVEENLTNPSGQSAGITEAGMEKKESKKRKKPSSEENGVTNVEEETLDDSKRRKTNNSYQSNGSANGSAEPKTAAKAFQRVKAEDVEFADERLQDNSYWAKDGADSGYGAKAQEVLGQVRGRDFRHEKTKKKRGSYRGGLIDLNTHSVKFNYDDDNE